MALKNSLRDSVEENGAKQQKRSHAERTYGRFFAGYTSMLAPRFNRHGEQKGYSTRYTYSGETWRQDLSREKRMAVKMLYGVDWLLCCILLCHAATRPVPANHCWYVTMFQAAALLGLGWMLLSLLYYIPAPEHMTIYTYKTMIGFHFRISRRLTFYALAGAAAASLLNLALDHSGETADRLMVTGYLIVCAALAGVVCLTERRIRYISSKDEAEG